MKDDTGKAIVPASVKIFLSHASEDKHDFVEPLVHALSDRGFSVWYDRFVMTLGDSLLQKISQGLGECDYGVVVLSPAFFSKKWTIAELDGLFALEDSARKVILPIWKGVSEGDVKRFSPILAGKLAVRASEGLLHVVEMIEQAVSVGNKVATFSPENAIRARFIELSKAIRTGRESNQILSSTDGVKLLSKIMVGCFENIESLVKEIADSTGLPFQAKTRWDQLGHPFFTLSGPFDLNFYINFEKLAENSASDAMLSIIAWKITTNELGQKQQPFKLRAHYFKPLVLDSLNVQWNSYNEVPTFSLLTGQIAEYFMQIVSFEVGKRATF